jgi:myo-inositol catabolism protein IolC
MSKVVRVGYNKPLYILPFDHRSSFEKGLYEWSGALSAEQTERIARTKEIIYDGFKFALGAGLAKDRAGILVDEQFGLRILRDAVANGFITALPAEKSGQAEFQFEFGEQYAPHIEQFHPTFVKVLVRYNTEDDAARNRRQAARLKELCDYCHSHNYYFLFELLVPATHEQMDRLDGDQTLYDRDLRPSLMIAAIEELQDAGVEPDVWKIEGFGSARGLRRDRGNGASRRSQRSRLYCPGARFQRTEGGGMASRSGLRARIHRICGGPDFFLGSFGRLARRQD